VGRYIREFQHSLQGIYTRTTRIIYPVDYVKTYSYIEFAEGQSRDSKSASYRVSQCLKSLRRGCRC